MGFLRSNLSFILITALLVIGNICEAQFIYQAMTQYSDSFKKWDIISTQNPFEEEPQLTEGTLETTWDINKDWSEWNYWHEDLRGSVKIDEQAVYIFFQNNSNTSESITARNIWARDQSEWKINYNDKEYKLNLLFNNQVEEWVLEYNKNIICNILTYEEGDLRNWVFDHHAEEAIALEVQQLALLIIINTVCPKV